MQPSQWSCTSYQTSLCLSLLICKVDGKGREHVLTNTEYSLYLRHAADPASRGPWMESLGNPLCHCRNASEKSLHPWIPDLELDKHFLTLPSLKGIILISSYVIGGSELVFSKPHCSFLPVPHAGTLHSSPHPFLQGPCASSLFSHLGWSPHNSLVF